MSSQLKLKKSRLVRRKIRIRSKIIGTKERPRLTVYRSSKHIYVQVIDDTAGRTLAQINTGQIEKGKLTKSLKAQTIGKELGVLLKKLKISEVIFDRGGYKYGGRVKQLAESVREAGIKI